jgi:8-oxo-dGTP pyrophosphatase MutT (NUDIX family)
VVIDRLANAPAEHRDPQPGARASAVLAVLHDGDIGTEVLITKRSMHLSSHRGELSFPGGRLDLGETFEEAALREAHEEVGLAAGQVQVIGRLDALSTFVSNSFIVPVVAHAEQRPAVAPASSEVDGVLWVPLRVLAEADRYREEWWMRPPVERPIFFFELDGETLWGATARMIHQILRIVHDVDTPPPPSWDDPR